MKNVVLTAFGLTLVDKLEQLISSSEANVKSRKFLFQSKSLHRYELEIYDRIHTDTLSFLKNSFQKIQLAYEIRISIYCIKCL